MKVSGFGKFGLKGNSGLGVGGFFHVSAPYDSNGKVFVEHTYRRKFKQNGKIETESMDSWKRMDLKAAKKQGKKIICCSMCDKPAVSLDHLWPYEILYNRCADHYHSDFNEKENKEKVKPSAYTKMS